MKCKNCDEEIEKGYDYGGSVYCRKCLSEHANDEFEIRQLAIDEWIENNCREVKEMHLKTD